MDLLHYTVNVHIRSYIGHILQMPSSRPTSRAVDWRPDDGRKIRGRPRKMLQDTLTGDIKEMWLEIAKARKAASDHAGWRRPIVPVVTGRSKSK